MAQKTLQSQPQLSDIFKDGAQLLGAKTRAAVLAIYTYVEAARDVANNKDAERAAHELADMRRQTEDAIESGRHLNPIIRDFGVVVRTYKIEEECIEALFESLYMDTINTTFTPGEYRKYIMGMGEAVALMVTKVLCYKRAVTYHKLTPVARSLGSAICKVGLLNEHGRHHKRHGRMYFPDVTKSTFNRARLAQIIVDIEADFRVARSGIAGLPPGSRKAIALVYAMFYDVLRQMRSLSPAQIDAGQAKISSFKKTYLFIYAYISPAGAIRRGSRY
jgi:phytoene/squalene synthetase